MDGPFSILLSVFCFLPFFGSVNAKQLEQPVFQAGPNRCESDHGCHLDLRFTSSARNWCISEIVLRKSKRSQGVISSARRSAKAEVRGASPRESTSSRIVV